MPNDSRKALQNNIYRPVRLLVALMAITMIFYSCDRDNEIIDPNPEIPLRFSTDTILFDTLFTSLGSITKRFRVFNDNNGAVRIGEIRLGDDTNSPYDIIVNGSRGKSFSDIEILGKDSLLILVDVTIDPRNQDLPFIVRDSVLFNTSNDERDVKLISWGQDANFLNDSVLVCNTTWTADRPYVIFNSVLVDSLCQLDIDPGARIFSHNESSIFVQGTLKVNGVAGNPVVFRNDRLDEDFVNAPGQWQGIFFLEGSTDNEINYAEIRNAEFGVWLGTPDDDSDADLVIRNTIIENISQIGVAAFTSDLEMENTLIDNCARNALGNFAGGNYTYRHCTIASFSFDFFRDESAVVFSDNLILEDNSVLTGDLVVNIDNCIIYGDFDEEIVLSNAAGGVFSITGSGNLLQTNIPSFTTGNIIGIDPLFVDARGFNYRLDTLSPAINQGQDLGVMIDLEGKARDAQPDIGAYEKQ